MGALDIVLLILLGAAVCGVVARAIWRKVRHKGGCCDCSGCKDCPHNCSGKR